MSKHTTSPSRFAIIIEELELALRLMEAALANLAEVRRLARNAGRHERDQ